MAGIYEVVCPSCSLVLRAVIENGTSVVQCECGETFRIQEEAIDLDPRAGRNSSGKSAGKSASKSASKGAVRRSKPAAAETPAHLADRLTQVSAVLNAHSTGLRDLFLKLDVSRTGTIEPSDLRYVLSEVGLALSDAEVRALIIKFDHSGTGHLHYADLVEWVESRANIWATTSHLASMSVGREPQSAQSASAAFTSPISTHSSTNSTSSAFPALSDQLAQSGLLSASVQPSLPAKTSREKKRALLSLIKRKLLQREGARDTFLRLDANRDAKISFDEFRDGMRALGVPLSQHTVKSLLGKFDKERNGTLDYAEFCAWLSEYDTNGCDDAATQASLMLSPRARTHCVEPDASKLGRAAFAAALREVVDEAADDAEVIKKVSSRIFENKWNLVNAFRQFDVDGDGYISAAEFKQAVRNLGLEVSEERMQRLIDAFDVSGKGQLACFEFVRMVADGGVRTTLQPRGKRAARSGGSSLNPHSSACTASAPGAASYAGSTGHGGGAGYFGCGAPVHCADGGSFASGVATEAMSTMSAMMASVLPAMDGVNGSEAAGDAAQAAAVAAGGSVVGAGGGVAGGRRCGSMAAAAATEASEHKLEAEAAAAVDELRELLFRQERNMRDVFKKLDRSGTKGLNARDLRSGLHSMGIDISDAEAARIVARFDSDGSGQIELGEFVRMLQSDPDRF